MMLASTVYATYNTSCSSSMLHVCNYTIEKKVSQVIGMITLSITCAYTHTHTHVRVHTCLQEAIMQLRMTYTCSI